MNSGVLFVIAIVATLGLAGCESDSAAVSTSASTASPSAGMVLPGGGLSVAEAISTTAEPPLAVGGWVVDSGSDARLCSGYNPGASDPCEQPSLALRAAGSVKSGTHVSLFGAVKGDTFVVSSTVQG